MLRKMLLFFVAFSVVFWADAQEKEDGEKMKIGLVLSGGGAKGLAHIGALKIIEESGLQIDYIGGTSMGAVVGSLYASGYTAAQLDSIFRTTNFRKLIQDDLPRNVKNHYEKMGDQRYAVTLPFDDFKLKFPSGLSKGQNLYNLLSQLMYPVNEVSDFSKLPIPFLCIGTDIETGERLVLEKGSLPQSVAASAAIPSVFMPVIIDDKLVSDGGVTDNYPVEELRSRGMDYIIGVDVQDSLVGKENLRTVIEIMTQVSNFRTIREMKEKRGKTDLYIDPDIREFSILSFDKGDKIVQSGEEAALRVKDKLDSLAGLQDRKMRNRGVVVPDSLMIREIKIIGNKNFQRNFIRGKLKMSSNKKISYQDFNRGLNNLSATGDFERIQYDLVPRNDEGNDLYLNLKETTGKKALQFGLHYDGLYKSAALINYTHKHLVISGDRLSLDFIPGENFRYKFNYFIDKGTYWSVGLTSAFTQFGKNVHPEIVFQEVENKMNVNKIQMDYVDLSNQIYIETFFFDRNALRFRAGFEHKYAKLKTGSFVEIEEGKNSEAISLRERGHAFGPYGFLEYDSYDNSFFPSRGFYFNGSMHNFLIKGKNKFEFDKLSVLKGNIGFATSPWSNFTIRGESMMGLHLGAGEWKALNFYLGGYGNDYVNNIVPFFGYSFFGLSGNSVIRSSLEVDYQPSSKNHFILGYNVANIGDDLFKQGQIFDFPDYSALYAGYGLETLLGPLEIYYSFSPEITQSRWFVSLGLWF